MWQALLDFGAPVEALGIRQQDFTTRDIIIQVGLPPRRIDLLTSLTGLDFATAWSNHITVTVAGITLPLLGRDSLLANKRMLARPQDLADVDALLRQEK